MKLSERDLSHIISPDIFGREKFTKREAYLYLVANAASETGMIVLSIYSASRAFGWSVKAVRSFLSFAVRCDLLELVEAGRGQKPSLYRVTPAGFVENYYPPTDCRYGHV